MIESAPGGEFQKGDVVATAMGGMGRDFDGGYAEYTVVPAKQVQTVSTSLSWEKLGALPELMNTVWGSLFKSLRLEKDDHFLIRGGTSSVGLAAAAIAKNYGMYPVKMAFPRWPGTRTSLVLLSLLTSPTVGCEFVAVTTRNQARVEQLKKTAHEIYLEDGNIAAQVAASHPQKFSKILELVGTATMEDSLRCAQDNGIVCVTGMAGGQWVAKEFSPLYAIPTSVCLTSFRSEVGFMSTPLENIAQMMAEGKLEFPIRTYTLDQISQAHQDMEDSNVMGKAVILLGEH